MVLEVVPLAVRARSVGGVVAAGDYAFDTGMAVMPVLWPGVGYGFGFGFDERH